MSGVVHVGARPGPETVVLLDHAQTRLVGAVLRWKRYRRWTASWLPGRCELCGARFTEGGAPGLNSGYSILGGGPAGQDDYRWICAVCFETGRDYFCWTVLDTRGEASQPPDLLEAAFGSWDPPIPNAEDAAHHRQSEADRGISIIAPLPRSR